MTITMTVNSGLTRKRDAKQAYVYGNSIKIKGFTSMEIATYILLLEKHTSYNQTDVYQNCDLARLVLRDYYDKNWGNKINVPLYQNKYTITLTRSQSVAWLNVFFSARMNDLEKDPLAWTLIHELNNLIYKTLFV